MSKRIAGGVVTVCLVYIGGAWVYSSVERVVVRLGV